MAAAHVTTEKHTTRVWNSCGFLILLLSGICRNVTKEHAQSEAFYELTLQRRSLLFCELH